MQGIERERLADLPDLDDEEGMRRMQVSDFYAASLMFCLRYLRATYAVRYTRPNTKELTLPAWLECRRSSGPRAGLWPQR